MKTGTVQKKTKKIVERECSLKLTGDQILEAIQEKYGVPLNANIFLHVPGGGDYSNIDLDIDHETPIQIEWVEEVEETESPAGWTEIDTSTD